MCSTPKPKRSVKAKTTHSSVSILSSMNNEKRRNFANRANQASDRRIAAQHNINNLMIKKSSSKKTKTKTNTHQPWFYWLLNEPLGELLRKLVS